MLQLPYLPAENQFTPLFEKITILAQALKHIPLDQAFKQKVFHQELLKSSLFSARIEGNQLTLASAQKLELNPRDRSKKEISNVLKALNKLESFGETLTKDKILEMHRVVMRGLDASAGKFRHESSAIFDQFGNVVYLTPTPEETQVMLTMLIEHMATQSSQPWQTQLLSTAACHYYFEKTHPFLDGNGRTGRVIMQAQLRKVKLFSEIILPLEQYFDEHKSLYYHYLEKNTRKLNGFFEFFLKGIVWSLETYLDDIKNLQFEAPKSSNLLPRREELLYLLKDHPYSSLDSLARRFPTIAQRTISYDLQQLVKLRLVVKHGSTRGVVYSAV